MKVTHAFDKLSVEKEVNEPAGFMLANKSGSYMFLKENPTSRYEGLFLFDMPTMYKTLENIQIKDRGTLKSLKNNFYSVEREFSNAKETFLMPTGFSSIIYEINKEKQVEVILDFKDSYDNKEFGRYYDIFWEQNCIVVKFTKRSDKKEDSTSGMEQYSLYLAMLYDGSEKNYNAIEEWLERRYVFDEKRNSKPFSRYVFHALNITGSKFVFSISSEKNKAVKEAQYIFSNLDKVKENEKNAFYQSFSNKRTEKIIESKKISDENKLAYLSALNSLNNLSVKSNTSGILAGLPWFFQFWSRDEAISIKALEDVDKEFARKLILNRMEQLQNDGRLPNIYSQNNPTNADAIGWLFSRASDFHRKAKTNIEILEKLKSSILKIKGMKIRHNKIIAMIRQIEKNIKNKEESNKPILENSDWLKKSISSLLNDYMKDGLIFNNAKETWMDTASNDAGRAGFNIEIQALTLSMLRHAHQSTKDKNYKKLEEELKQNIIKKFWKGKSLLDNLEDKTIRPNAFLAYYIYPELLKDKDWEKCFETILASLWLDWGGLSTIDKKSSLFAPKHTGEQEQSYHRGDSWFWINNLAAIALFNINNKKFKNNIEKIMKASTEEILWKGILGAHSELSSAESLNSEGCLNQAWSNAMYVELIDSLYQKY